MAFEVRTACGHASPRHVWFVCRNNLHLSGVESQFSVRFVLEYSQSGPPKNLLINVGPLISIAPRMTLTFSRPRIEKERRGTQRSASIAGNDPVLTKEGEEIIKA